MSKYRADGPAVYGNPARVVRDPKTRQWLYGIAVAVVPLLTVYGIVAESDVALWVGLAGAVLGTGAPALAAANTPSGGPERDPNVRA